MATFECNSCGDSVLRSAAEPIGLERFEIDEADNGYVFAGEPAGSPRRLLITFSILFVAALAVAFSIPSGMERCRLHHSAETCAHTLYP